jgi:tRNA dimethylallyltransferase
MMQKIIVVLGQTATGKSDLAVKIAKKIGGEIISADSRQIYKNLNIGTGKIARKDMMGVPHHLLSVANPKKQFTVAEYKKLAEEEIKEILFRNKTPIICGGTGFYIDSVTQGIMLPEVPPNRKLRENLGKKKVETLFNMLAKLDRERAENIDHRNKVRLIRAIEVAKALGKVPVLEKVKPKYKFIKIGLYLPQNELRVKVEKRVKLMFRKGLLREIRNLKKLGVSNRRLRELGFEYYNPTYESVVKATLGYAKRQMTWFKRDKKIKWFTNASSALAAFPKLWAK